MRYVGLYDRLLLIQNDGTVRHRFRRGVLILGAPGGSAAGETVDVTQSAPALPTELQAVFPGGATAAEQVGLGKNFWAAPPLAAADALTAGEAYEVLSAPVSYDGTVLVTGQRFVATATTNFTGAGTVALAVPFPPGSPRCSAQYDHHFHIKHLQNSSEDVGVSPWSTDNPNGVTGPAPGFLAEQ